MGFLPTTTYEENDIDIQYIAFLFQVYLCWLQEYDKLFLYTTEIFTESVPWDYQV